MPPVEHIHLLGIAGSGMAALAGMLAESGYRVTGSDVNVYPPASTLLESLGIPWKEGFQEENLQPAPDLVVVGNIMARGNPEIECVLDQRIPYKSMPQTIRELFLPGRDSVVVAGTHGKTTTTSLLAWIFQVGGRRPNFLIGGVAENFGRSYGLGGGGEFIIEGDEYETAFFDRAPKFFHYRPDELILTSVEFDHADIYADLAAIELQFRRLVNLVPRRGRIVACAEPSAGTVGPCVAKALCPVETYALSCDADWRAGDIEFVENETRFRVSFRGQQIADIRTPLGGRHNILNVLAAVAIAHGRGVPRGAIEQALLTFRSVRRRLEVKGEASGVLVVDDFAHHPTAIRETLAAARQLWWGASKPRKGRLWAVVEPRSNTMRRKIFEQELPQSLGAADAVLFGPVHRASLLADAERLDPQQVVECIAATGKSAAALPSADAIASYLAERVAAGDAVLVMSNGSFDGLCEKLIGLLRKREGKP